MFSIKNLRVFHYFLGVKVLTTSHGMLLIQSKHIQDVRRTKMSDAKEVHTLSTSFILSLHDSVNLFMLLNTGKLLAAYNTCLLHVPIFLF